MPMFGELSTGENYPMDGFTFTHFDETLDRMWSTEYSNLTLGLQMLLIADFSTCDECERRDYFYNIGAGNLEGYAKVLASQLSK